MKCDEPNPQSNVTTCQEELLHDGDHEYQRDRWPRPVPNELSPEVAELLEATRPERSWDVDERTYPVVVEVATTYVVWVDAESEDAALDQLDGAEGDLDLGQETSIGGHLEIQRADRWGRAEAFHSRHSRFRLGPVIACPDCGKTAFEREWYHDPFRKCHGPIVWRAGVDGPRREWQPTPAHTAEGGDAR